VSTKRDLVLYRALFNLSNTFLKIVIKNVESHGMTIDNFRILELLYSETENHTIQMLSEKLQIPSGSITYVVNRLMNLDYIEKTPYPTDKRASYVNLTTAGKNAIRKIIPEHVKFISSKMEEINEEEKQLLINLLNKLG